MHAIKHAYQTTFGRSMEADVKSDLSMKTERLFGMVMAASRADESTPVNLQELDYDCSELHRATEGKVGTDQITVCSILASRSDGQLRAISQHYQQKYHIALVDVIKKEFSGHMEDALLLMLNRALDRAMTDAVQLEETMKGIGTKDSLLVNRVVRVHWDKDHLDQVRKAYLHRYKRDLIARVKGETKGDFEKLLVACLEG
jgi:annexin A7/11